MQTMLSFFSDRGKEFFLFSEASKGLGCTCVKIIKGHSALL